MNEITDYSITSAGTIEELAKGIRSILKDGWQPAGSVFQDDNGLYIQPVVKYHEPYPTPGIIPPPFVGGSKG